MEGLNLDGKYMEIFQDDGTSDDSSPDSSGLPNVDLSSQESFQFSEDSNPDSSDSSLSPLPSHFRTFFEIIKPLGGGAFGAVWLCKHRITKKCYAVKRIIMRESQLDRISREAEILARLEHRNVVSYNHCWHEPCTVEDKSDNKALQSDEESCEEGDSQEGEEDEEKEEDGDEDEDEELSFYLCMQYCNSTLKEEIKSNADLDPYQIAKQIVDGIRHIHESKVIHSDLSCLNILMDGNTPKIADFGLAVLLNDGDIGVSPSMSRNGNLTYLAPELHEESPLLTCMADVYSLGIIFLELFFARGMETETERAKLIENFKKYEDFPEVKVHVHEGVMSMILEMTLHDPNARIEIEDVSCEILSMIQDLEV